MSVKENVPSNVEWILSNLLQGQTQGIKVMGNPQILKCKYGNAVTFNGSDDALFLDSNPLSGLEQFTVEVIFQPSGGGNFEQRFLHFGEANSDRVLLELRATDNEWYFDGFIKIGEQGCTLIDPALLHPLDQWYHVAYVIDNGKIVTYVNSKKELEGEINMISLKKGLTSIGVRQNEVSWFKGAIYKIRITGEALKPVDFMSY